MSNCLRQFLKQWGVEEMAKVVKFGGSSLASAEQFKKVGDITEDWWRVAEKPAGACGTSRRHLYKPSVSNSQRNACRIEEPPQRVFSGRKVRLMQRVHSPVLRTGPERRNSGPCDAEQLDVSGQLWGCFQSITGGIDECAGCEKKYIKTWRLLWQ